MWCVGPASSQTDGLGHPLIVVAHGRVKDGLDATGGQALGDVAGVGVDHVSAGEFAPHGQELGRHGAAGLLPTAFG